MGENLHSIQSVRAVVGIATIAVLGACGSSEEGGTSLGDAAAERESGGASGQGGAGAVPDSSTMGGRGGNPGTGGSAAADGSSEGGAAPTAAELSSLVQTCANVVSVHRYATDDGRPANIDICSLNGAVFWKADMDIDCDGRDVGDGKCPGDDCCYQPETAFTNKSGRPLAASVTPYVVIPSDFTYAGLKGGTVVAVIYNNRIQYSVFGDTGPNNIIGEASYACADRLGINPDPGNGGTDGPVTYIAFVGAGTVPADIEDQAETQRLGERLAAMLVQGN